MHDDYDNLKSEAKVLNEIIERLQGVEGSNSELSAEADKLRYRSQIMHAGAQSLVLFVIPTWCPKATFAQL